MPGPRVYLTKTALSGCLRIGWEGGEREPQTQDRIILQKDGSYLGEIRPTDYERNTYETEIQIPLTVFQLMENKEKQSVKESCLGSFSVEWIDEEQKTIAKGCIKTNPTWMEEAKMQEEEINLKDIILTGTHYSGMYTKRKKEAMQKKKKLSLKSLITDVTKWYTQTAQVDDVEFLLFSPSCLIWGEDCPENFKEYLKSASSNIFTEFESFKSHPIVDLVLKFVKDLYNDRQSLLDIFIKLYLSPICPVDKMTNQDIDEIIKIFLLTKFKEVFTYIQKNWVFVHHETILEQLILGVRYQDIHLLYDKTADYKFWMGKGCFKGHPINEGVSQLKSFLKNTRELVVWEINIEDTRSNYICGDNSLEWDQEVIEQLVWQLEYDLGDWLIKPGETILDIWNTPVNKLFQGTGQLEGQGRLILVTQEPKFLGLNKIFFEKPSETFERMNNVSRQKRLLPEELLALVSGFQGDEKLFSFEGHLNPTISDFMSTIKTEVFKLIDFLETLTGKVISDLLVNSALALPQESLKLVEGVWDMIEESVKNFFNLGTCMFSIFPIDDIADFLEDAIESVFNELIKPIKSTIDTLDDAVDTVSSAIDSINPFRRAKRAIDNVPGRILADFVYDMSCSNFSRYRKQRKRDNYTHRISCPRVDFGQCQNAIFNLIPSPSKLTSPIFEILMIPFKEFFKLYDETLRSTQDTFKPACKAMIQYSLDVQFEKLLDYEFGNLPGFASLPVTKFKIRTFYERLVNILDFYSDSLPGMKKFADDVNEDVDFLNFRDYTDAT